MMLMLLLVVFLMIILILCFVVIQTTRLFDIHSMQRRRSHGIYCRALFFPDNSVVHIAKYYMKQLHSDIKVNASYHVQLYAVGYQQ